MSLPVVHRRSWAHSHWVTPYPSIPSGPGSIQDRFTYHIGAPWIDSCNPCTYLLYLIGMSARKKELEELLASPVASAEDAERAAQAAEALAAYIRAEERAERVLRGGSLDKATGAGGSLAGLALHEAAERVLDQAGIPLHVRELGRRIKAGGWTHPRSTRAGGDLIQYQLAARLPKHPERFRRAAPNTFALTKWGDEPATAAPARRRVGLFRGPGGATGRDIGESSEEVAKATWRSS
ncbi:hypothetical protein BH24ACT26_BH24ACT26_18420 [soil metagenome]